MVLNQDEEYYARMASSIGDKAKLLPFVSGSRVLEIGFGGGELMDILHNEGYEVYGLDASAVSVGKVKDSAYHANVREGYADEILHHWNEGFFDTIILSSVMHEVFSYGNRGGKHKHSLSAIGSTLDVIFAALAPGGKVVIRDGVLANDWDRKVEVVMLNEDVQGVKNYLEAQPFKNRVSLTQIRENVFLGNLESATSFAYTYTWGEASLPRESQELFGVMTRKEYCSLLEEKDFTVLHHEEYVQPGYVKALSPKLRFQTPEGEPVSFPSTNAVWIAGKF